MAVGKGKAQAAQNTPQRLKIVVRRLPPDLPEHIFWKSVAPWVVREIEEPVEGQEKAEKVEWTKYRPGKIRRSGKDKDDVQSRAYISFKTPDALVAFHQAYDGWSFRDKQGNTRQAVVEFAPYQRLSPATVKPDPRQGTIDSDADFKAFEEALVAPITIEKIEDALAADKSLPKSTPLLDHLRALKAAELSNRSARYGGGTSASTSSGPKIIGAKKDVKASKKSGKNSDSQASSGSKEKGKGKDKSKSKSKALGAAGGGKKAAEGGRAATGPASSNLAEFPVLSNQPPQTVPTTSIAPSQASKTHSPRAQAPNPPQGARQQRPPHQNQSRREPPQPQIQLLTRRPPQSTPPPQQAISKPATPSPNPGNGPVTAPPQQAKQPRAPPARDNAATAGQRRQIGAALGAVLGEGAGGDAMRGRGRGRGRGGNRGGRGGAGRGSAQGASGAPAS